MITNKNLNNKKFNQKKFNNPLLFDLILTLLIFAIIFIIILNPTKYSAGTISGLKLFFFSVLPGLFPFMLLTKLITEIGFIFNITQKFDRFSYKVFGTPGVSLYAYFMSILSGYPIGAKIISDLYKKGQINEIEAKKMCLFCTTSGPIFVIGAVGTAMFKSYKIGLILYFSHILSSTILAILYNLFLGKTKYCNLSKTIIVTKKSNIIAECINQTINSLFVVGAYITIFYLLTEILDSLKFFDILIKTTLPFFSKLGLSTNQLNGVFYGFLEVTRGAKALSISQNNLSTILASGILSFSGLSIIMQSMSFLKDAKIKAHTFICFKCVHMVFSMFLCGILIIIF